jgi:nucleotide-binding universal stress UspA family protein
VAEEVLRGAACPVLAVKNGPVKPTIQSILFPTDLSDSSESALGVAFSLARDYHARLLVLHVAPLGGSVPYGEFERMLKQSAGYRLELEDKLRHCQRPECNAEFRVEEGDPAAEIIRVAQESRCDVIVMGTHGRTGLRRLLQGSVAEKTLRGASRSVLLVKHPMIRVETSPEPQHQPTEHAR